MQRSDDSIANSPSFVRNPAAWLRDKRLSKSFWIFFTAAFFFDFGFAIYYFLFNLYLLDLHYDVRAIGLVGGALTLGSLAGTLPAGLLARHFGLKPLLLVCFTAAPVLCVLRLFIYWQPAQIAMTFLAGMAMCLWGVCFLPAVANLTTPENRASAFSLIFSVSIGTSAVGGLLCSYLPRLLVFAGFHLEPVQVKRSILVFSCVLAAVGVVSILRLRLPSASDSSGAEAYGAKPWRFAHLHPFLKRFLPAMALWTAVLASFNPFANVFLSRQLHLPVARIGLLFAAVQVIQFSAGLLTPALFRRFGLAGGVALTQLTASLLLALLASTQSASFAVALYLSFSATQWMCSPGLYNLLMSGVPENYRSTASAVTMFTSALVSSAATAGTGFLFGKFGYPPVLLGIAATALLAAAIFYASFARPTPTADMPAPPARLSEDVAS